MPGDAKWSFLNFFAKTAVLAGLFGMSAWWSALAWGAEHHWVTAALLYVPFYFYLVPLAGIALLALRLRWWWRVIALAPVLIAVWPVMGLTLPDGDAVGGRLRFMTYNVKAYLSLPHTGGVDGIAQEVERADPDIIVMQDAGLLAQADSGGKPYWQQVAGARKTYVAGQYVVASRLPLRDCATGLMSFGAQQHTFVHCVITAYGHDIDVYTAHFLSPREGLNALRHNAFAGQADWADSVQTRMEQARALASHLWPRRRPVIVAGDLNAPEQSLVVQTLLDAGLRDAFSAAGTGYGFTHGHTLGLGISTVRIDHVLVSPEIGVRQCITGDKFASDHRPVIADLLVN